MGCHDALLQRVRGLLAVGQESQAEAALRRAASSHTADRPLYQAIGELLLTSGRFLQAEFYIRRALSLKPSNPEDTEALAKALMGQQKFDAAHKLLSDLISANPQHTNARIILATSLRRQKKTASSLAVLKEALKPGVNDAALLNAYAHALHAAGRVEEAVPILRRVIAAAGDQAPALDGYCSVLNYCPGITRHELLDAHARFGRAIEHTPAPRPPGAGALRLPGRPLRVGLLSSDLRDHVIPMFIAPFIEHADRKRTRLTCFNTSPVEDAVSARLREKSDAWHWLPLAPPAKVADCIRKESIDILIELNGHTRGHKLDALALRPAPVQITYLGYPATTGMKSIDFRIVDSTTDPHGSEDFCTERLLRIDPCFLCYRPPASLPPINTRPDQPVTFVSFTNLAKLSSPLIALWAGVLQAVPGSRLLMKHYSLLEQEVRADLAARFAAHSIPADRLDLRPPIEDRADHLAAYHDADICLDTAPYNGTTTIFESLLMGVPVITLSGKFHAGRVTQSLLANVGLDDLVAPNEEAYIAKAAALAADAPRRAELRATLRERLLNSPLCDEPAFARRLTDALYRAWDTIGSLPPTPAPPSPRSIVYA